VNFVFFVDKMLIYAPKPCIANSSALIALRARASFAAGSRKHNLFQNCWGSAIYFVFGWLMKTKVRILIVVVLSGLATMACVGFEKNKMSARADTFSEPPVGYDPTT
jgi:hypothetical protein